MIVIDGSAGEGGGQILRNALALSLITGQPFRMENVRGRRKRPGLMRQHITAVEAACEIGGASCEGLQVGASVLTFRPGKVIPGSYHFAIGTAGSTGLVLQALLAPLMLADAPSRIVLEGGTHNMQAPAFEFLARAYLPLVNRMGPRVEARLIRHGFYPRGGGRIEVDVEPARLQPLDCMERGATVGVRACAVVAGLSEEIARRELTTARKLLDWPGDVFVAHQLPEELGPGNVLMLEARFEHVTEIVTGFGKLGVSSELLARKAARRMAGYLGTSAFAGPFLADQLVTLFMLAGAGRFTTVSPSEHTRSAMHIGGLFLDRHCRIDPEPDGRHVVSVT